MSTYELTRSLQLAHELILRHCSQFTFGLYTADLIDRTLILIQQHARGWQKRIEQEDQPPSAECVSLQFGELVLHLSRHLACVQRENQRRQQSTHSEDSDSGLDDAPPTVSSVVQHMEPAQVARLITTACEGLQRVVQHFSSTPHASTKSQRQAPQAQTASKAMQLLRVVFDNEPNSLLWHRHFGGEVSVPANRLAEVLVMKELGHLDPIALRSRIVSNMVFDVLDLNRDDVVDVADIAVMCSSGESLIRTMEEEAQREVQDDITATDDRDNADVEESCARCKRLEAELILLRRENSELRSRVAVTAPHRNNTTTPSDGRSLRATQHTASSLSKNNSIPTVCVGLRPAEAASATAVQTEAKRLSRLLNNNQAQFSSSASTGKRSIAEPSDQQRMSSLHSTLYQSPLNALYNGLQEFAAEAVVASSRRSGHQHDALSPAAHSSIVRNNQFGAETRQDRPLSSSVYLPDERLVAVSAHHTSFPLVNTAAATSRRSLYDDDDDA